MRVSSSLAPGETRKKLAFVLYHDASDANISNSPKLIQAVQSILDTTKNDEFGETMVILPVLDGAKEDSSSSPADVKRLASKLREMDHQATGVIQVLINHEKQIGVSRSRLMATDYLHTMTRELKMDPADICLIFVRDDVVLQSHWTEPVLEALHLYSPTIAQPDTFLRLSNIVSFAVQFPDSDHLGASVGYNMAMDPQWKKQQQQQQGSSTTTTTATSAGLAGAVSAMRFRTFLDMVVQDQMLYSASAADLNMALNVWLCGDGIDVLPGARAAAAATTSDHDTTAGVLTDFEAGRIAGTWMTDGPYSAMLFHAREAASSLSSSSRALYMQKVMDDVMKRRRYQDDAGRCRSFEWFMDHVNVNPEWNKIAMQLEDIDEAGQVENEVKKKAKRYTDATDENGNLGFIYDEKWLRNEPSISEKMSCPKTTHKRVLTEKVQLAKPSAKAPKIFCVVYTIEEAHHKIPGITSTWGPKCDGFMVASTKTVTEPGIHTVNIIHDGPEEYNNIWQKVRSIWRYVYENYFDEYDYFHIGGDDLFLIPENLKYYLESDEITSITDKKPLFMGRRFAEQGNTKRIFNSGGSGYTMNKLAMELLATQMFEREDRQCAPVAHTFAEDVMVASCFRFNNIFPYDTRDELGSERYMPFMPGHHLTYQAPKNPDNDWYMKYMGPFDMKFGLDHCSKNSVAFHYVNPDDMKLFYGMMHGLCK